CRDGLHIGGRAHLQRDSLVPDVGREASELDRSVHVLANGYVIDDPYAVAEAIGATPLDCLPNRGEPERLAGVDGEVEVLPLHVLERVEVAGRRIASLRARDVDTHHARAPT